MRRRPHSIFLFRGFSRNILSPISRNLVGTNLGRQLKDEGEASIKIVTAP
jgi:hypothetical protein